MECHKCPHAADVAAGKFKSVAWASTPCAACAMPKQDTIRFVRYDESKALLTPPPEAPPPADLYPLTTLGHALKLVFSLSIKEYEVLRLRFAGWSFEDIGRVLRCSTHAASVRFVRVTRRAPAIAALFGKTVRLKPGKVSASELRRERMRAVTGAVKSEAPKKWRCRPNGECVKRPANEPPPGSGVVWCTGCDNAPLPGHRDRK